MSPDQSTLGVCPSCGADIPPARVLIRYETADAQEATFAECPDCTAVVHPAHR